NFREGSLSSNMPNLFNQLNRNGYHTTLFGKCHFKPVPYGKNKPGVTRPYEEFRQYYLDLGLDHLELQDDKQVSVWFYDDYAKELDNAGYLKSYRQAVWDKTNQKVFNFPCPPEWHPDSWVGRKSQEYIKSYDGEKPLFSWISFSGPHFPFDPPEIHLTKVDMKKDKQRYWHEGEFDDVKRIHHHSFHGERGIEGANEAPGKATKNFPEEYWHQLRKSYYANIVLID